MEASIAPVLLGIVSSLVATFIFLWLNWLFRVVVLPWYSDKIYRGVRLDGNWTLSEVNKTPIVSKTSMLLELHQKGDQLTGIYSHITVSNLTEFYDLQGFIRDTFITLTWKPRAKDNIDAGAAVLRAFTKDDKLTMKGILTFVDTETGEVEGTRSIAFHKQRV